MPSFENVTATIAATGALGLAAMALVDAFKAVPGGGVSRIGFGYIRAVLVLFDQVLLRAVGKQWETVIMSHWINGRPRGEQIAVIRSLLRLGLNAETAPQLAAIGNVAADALAKAATKMVEGKELTEGEINLIGRVEAAVAARLDAAFDLADQSYRNKARVLAGVISVALALIAAGLLGFDDDLGMALLIGLLAVPIAPISKDLVSALTAASRAVRAPRGG